MLTQGSYLDCLSSRLGLPIATHSDICHALPIKAAHGIMRDVIKDERAREFKPL